MNNPLPTGTVTFLFTDIQGSTPLWECASEKMAEALQVHNAALRQAIETHGGVIFKFIGDEYQAVFSTATQALKAAIEGQRMLQAAQWNELGELRVRMGLHTGEAELDPGGDEYTVSHTKNRAGRVRSAAYGGQILLSQESTDLVKRKLPEGVTLKDLGEHKLKGMEWLEHLFQVCAPGLTQDFPPLANGITHLNNLPLQMTSFVGREKEIAEVIRLLAKHRLVTLTGSGGTGKTRLSLQVAEQVIDGYPNGVWFVELASLSDLHLVPQAVASIFSLHQEANRPILDTLVDFLKEKQVLIILDNCEHLIEACAQLAVNLLYACPRLKLLTSSREALGVDGEMPYRVPSMDFPESHQINDLVKFCDYESVWLFVERAQAPLPGFRVTEKNAPAVSKIIQRLDGIPLAIELATARLNILTVEELTQRLDNVFRLLVGGSRTVLPRHQTLRATINWSYNLLNEQERILLRRLSVFAGSCTLEAAEAVCARGGIEGGEILDILSSLVNKSMVIAERKQERETRYRLLKMVQQYAREKIFNTEESESLRDLHLDYFLKLSEQAESHMRGNSQQQWKERLDVEMDNLRLAMEWSLSGSIEKGLLLAAALCWFWHGTYHRIEGVEWLDRLLAAEIAGRDEPSLEPERIHTRLIARGKALNAAYWNKSKIGQIESKLVKESVAIFQAYSNLYPKDLAYSLYLLGVMDFQESLELFRQIEDQFYLSEVLFHLAAALLRSGDLAQARIYFEERQELCKEREDLEGEGCGLWELGLLEFLQGNTRRAVESFKASRALLKASNQEFYAFVIRFQAWIALAQGDIYEAIQFSQEELAAAQGYAISWVIVDALGFLGWEARVLEDEDQAVQRCEEALRLTRQVAPGSLYFAYYVLGRVAITRGQYAKASAYLKELVTHIDAVESPHKAAIESPPVHLGIQVYGILAATQAENSPTQARRAAILFGAQASMVACLMNIIPPKERLEYEQAVVSVHKTLGEETFTAAWEEGRAMTLEQAVALALEEYE